MEVSHVKFPYNQCNYKATRKDSLLTHIQSKHEGVRFPCPRCNYKATQMENLLTHINSIHEGIKGFNFHLICSASKDENILLCLEYVIGSPMVTHQVNCVVASFCNILNEFFLQFTSNILTHLVKKTPKPTKNCSKWPFQALL